MKDSQQSNVKFLCPITKHTMNNQDNRSSPKFPTPPTVTSSKKSNNVLKVMIINMITEVKYGISKCRNEYVKNQTAE